MSDHTSKSTCFEHRQERWKAELGSLTLSGIPQGLRIGQMGTFDVTSEKGGSILFSFYTQNLSEGEKFKLLVDGVVKF